MRRVRNLGNGWVWPAEDTECASVIFDRFNDLEKAMSYCRKKDVVVQAGGNCGVWPKYLASRFMAVYTFEPEPTNFFCLVNNVPEGNVFKMQAALGAHDEGPTKVMLDPKNCGAGYIEGRGPIPVIALDTLNLPTCDLIYLDIEGYELPALNGATRTISVNKPVVAFEDKGLSQRYGWGQGKVEAFLKATFNYEVVARVNRDVIMRPRS